MSAPLMPVWNQLLRFALEMVALVGLGAFGWSLTRHPTRWLLAITFPLVAAVAWATFRVTGDPGPAPVAVAGWLRLAIELSVLGGGALGLAHSFGRWAGLGVAAATILHYATTLERLQWMMAT
jgi:hypothetical protein